MQQNITAVLDYAAETWKFPSLESPYDYMSKVPVILTTGSLTVTGHIAWPSCDLDKLSDLEGVVEVFMETSGHISKSTGFQKHDVKYLFI